MVLLESYFQLQIMDDPAFNFIPYKLSLRIKQLKRICYLTIISIRIFKIKFYFIDFNYYQYNRHTKKHFENFSRLRHPYVHHSNIRYNMDLI